MLMMGNDSQDKVGDRIRIIIGICLIVLAFFFIELFIEVFFGVPGPIGIALGAITTISVIAGIIALLTLHTHFSIRRHRVHLIFAANGAFWLLLALVSAAIYSMRT